jgi:hypothetical protein
MRHVRHAKRRKTGSRAESDIHRVVAQHEEK